MIAMALVQESFISAKCTWLSQHFDLYIFVKLKGSDSISQARQYALLSMKDILLNKTYQSGISLQQSFEADSVWNVF